LSNIDDKQAETDIAVYEKKELKKCVNRFFDRADHFVLCGNSFRDYVS